MDGIRQNSDNALLILVLDDSGALQSLQRIYPDGSKRFLLQAVSLSAIRKCTDSAIIICADNDEAVRKRAEETAKAANAKFVVPVFAKGRGTDFNDLHQTESLDAVRSQLEAALHTQHGLVALDMERFLSMEIPDRGVFYCRSCQSRE